MNSVLQALYFCKPFRTSLMSYANQVDNLVPFSPLSTRAHSETGSVTSSPPSSRPLGGDTVPMFGLTGGSIANTMSPLSETWRGRKQSTSTEGAPPIREQSATAPLPRSDVLFESLVRLFYYMALSATKMTLEKSRTSTKNPTGSPESQSDLFRRAGGSLRTLSQSASSRSESPGNALSPWSGRAQPAILNTTVDEPIIKSFLTVLRRENELFNSTMHQDAHELLNFVLNKIGEDLVHAARQERMNSVGSGAATSKRESEAHVHSAYAPHPVSPQRAGPQTGVSALQRIDEHGNTCVHRLFQGLLTNETRCLMCETVTSRDEAFLDLSINISPDTSLSSCLRQFSESEMLSGRNKFFCDRCSSLQEAEKRMKIKQPPNVLALHLKRFRWDDASQLYVKLGYRVVFPLDLRLFNTSEQANNPDRLYELFGIVVHIGGGLNQGHYVSIVKVGQRWVLFDDDTVDVISESDIPNFYGDSPDTGSAYVLFYQAVDMDHEALGLSAESATYVSPSPNDRRNQSMGTRPPTTILPESPLPTAAPPAAATATPAATTPAAATPTAETPAAATPTAATPAAMTPATNSPPAAAQPVPSPAAAPSPVDVGVQSAAASPKTGSAPSNATPLASTGGTARRPEEASSRRFHFGRSALSRTLRLGRGDKGQSG